MNPESYRRMARSFIRMAQAYAEQLRGAVAEKNDEQAWHCACSVRFYREMASSYFGMWRHALQYWAPTSAAETRGVQL